METSQQLAPPEETLFRSVMKFACQDQDRVDLSAVQCHTRHMNVLWSGHMVELKRLDLFLSNHKRCVSRYHRQSSDVLLHVHMVSEWARDHLGRKSTGILLRRSEHLPRHMSCPQALVAPSSSEAEHYELIRGVSALDDRCADQHLLRQSDGAKCGTPTWTRRAVATSLGHRVTIDSSVKSTALSMDSSAEADVLLNFFFFESFQ